MFTFYPDSNPCKETLFYRMVPGTWNRISPGIHFDLNQNQTTLVKSPDQPVLVQ